MLGSQVHCRRQQKGLLHSTTHVMDAWKVYIKDRGLPF